MEKLRKSWQKISKHQDNAEKLSKHFFRALSRSNLREGVKPLGEDKTVGITEQQFKETFGSEGIKITTQLMTARALNGGKAHEDEEGYFNGVEYSIAAGFYLMDRALSTHNSAIYRKCAYDQFVNDTNRMWNETKREIEGKYVAMPTQKRLQDICRPYLKQLRDLKKDKNLHVSTHNDSESPAHLNHSA